MDKQALNIQEMAGIIHQKHKDRYRIQFCDENYYRTHQIVFEKWQNRFKPLEKAEKLQAWVVALSCLRRPEDWYGGPRPTPLISLDKNFTHSLNLGQIFADTPVRIPPKLRESMNLFEFLVGHRVKALPESCYRSLCFMTSGRYPLRLSSGVVSPFELLQIQLRGQRIVSMDEDFREWPSRLYSGRDYLGFILHDLIHADHFFYEPQHRDGQLGFYRFVNSFISVSRDLSDLLSIETFREGFEYIISDMNSHPLHLFQTLHSLLFKTLGDDTRARDIWCDWIKADAPYGGTVTDGEFAVGADSGRTSPFSADETGALLRINARDFSVEESLIVERLCQRLAKPGSH